ncbi:hypothetical protein KRM28CT15_43850 [Krasilnikovia sp. M28-CT-15]
MAVGRHRRLIVALALAVAVVFVMAHFWVPTLAQRAFPTLAVLVLGTLALATVVLALPRPRAFEVRSQVPAFSTPSSPAAVFLMLAMLIMAMELTGTVIRDLDTTETFVDRLLPLGAVVLTVQLAVGVWRGQGIELRPDGLRDREWAGTLIVPWDALPVVPLPRPTDPRGTLPVGYARPELVRRHGLVTSRRRLYTDNIDQRFVARVIRYYTTHPEHRSAIGTRVEYDRLLSAISDPPSGPPDQDL